MARTQEEVARSILRDLQRQDVAARGCSHPEHAADSVPQCGNSLWARRSLPRLRAVGVVALLLAACAVYAGVVWRASEQCTPATRRILADASASTARRQAALVRLKADVLETLAALDLAARDPDPVVKEQASRAIVAIQGKR